MREETIIEGEKRKAGTKNSQRRDQNTANLKLLLGGTWIA